MLTPEQTAFYHAHGFLHMPAMFTAAETAELSAELDRLVEDWAFINPGWSGPWRQAYMDPDTEKKAQLQILQDLQFYSAAWMRAVTHPRLVACMADLLGSNVELHHSILTAKPPQTGQPFPLHQDHPFYAHADGRFVDVLVHLDDTHHANGEIRFLDGSHKQGGLPHITRQADGTACAPHLPTDQYKLADTVPVPAKAGDAVAFCIHTVHGSYMNTTRYPRRLVRIGYRDPGNRQLAGRSLGRPNLMVRGYRTRRSGMELFSTAGPAPDR